MIQSVARRLWMAALFLLPGGAEAAEREYSFNPAVYALQGGRVVPVQGPVLDKGTVLLRDGMIEAVGADLPIPPDAIVLDCSGLNVYPGLIDARTNLLQPSPQQKQDDQEQAKHDSGPPPAIGYGHEMPEVQPEREGARLLVFKDVDLEKWRAAGFTAALSVPRGKIFVGQSVLLSLAGGHLGELVIRPRVALHLNFEKSGENRFPASLMGVLALIRQTFLDAEHYSLEMERFQRLAGQNVRRPRFDSALEALEPVLRRELPVYWDAPNWLDALRALELSKEFGLQPVLVGVRDAYKIVPQLERAGAVVVLSLNYPKKGEGPPDSGFEDRADGHGSGKGVDNNEEADEDNDSLYDLRERLHTPESAGLLQKAGIRFVLTTYGLSSPADFSKNVALAIEKGLAKDAALAALTLEPARLLGVDSMLGSLTPGKIGDVLVTEGELFDTKAKVRYLFIDGRKIEMGEKAKKGDPDAKIEPSGTWELSVDTKQGKIAATLHLQGSEGSYGGDVSAMGQSLGLSSVEVDGDAVTLHLDGAKVGANGDILMEFTVAGDSLSGSVTMPDGESAGLQGSRTSGPKEGGAR